MDKHMEQVSGTLTEGATGRDGVTAAAYTGPEWVELNGTVYTGPNVEGDCARTLIGQGVDPAIPLVFTRNGTPALRGTIDAFAARAWGGPGRDPQFVRWKPHPQGSYASLLVRWHVRRPLAGSAGRVGRVGVEEASGAGKSVAIRNDRNARVTDRNEPVNLGA